MNKTVLAAIAIVIILLVGIAFFLASKKSSTTPNAQTPNSVTLQPTKTVIGAIQGTLKSLLASGNPQACMYTTTMQNTSVNGTVFVASGKMRGDFTSNGNQAKISGHMIVDSNYTYIWTDASNQGIKMQLNQVQPSITPSINTQSANLDQNVSYTCTNWNEDDTKFNIPTNVTFNSFTLPSGMVLPSGTSQSSNYNQSACNACNNLPAAAQSACKSQLHCQ